MLVVSTSQWYSLERLSATLFLVGGVLFIVAATIDVANIVVGMEELRLGRGQAFIDAGWIAALVGHGVTALVAFVSEGPAEEVIPVFVFVVTSIGVMFGSILAFVTFGVTILRTDIHPRTVGILLLVPTLIFITNTFVLSAIGVPNPRPSEVTLFIVLGLAVTMLTIGYLLRTDSAPTDSPEPAPAQTAE